MKAEDTLQYMFDFYGSIFPTRKEALNHLFCVNENGYKWNNGELVDDSCDYLKKWELKKQTKKAVEPWGNPYRGYEFKWYPLCKYSKILCIPEDIKEDWLILVNECKKLLIEDGINIENIN